MPLLKAKKYFQSLKVIPWKQRFSKKDFKVLDHKNYSLNQITATHYYVAH